MIEAITSINSAVNGVVWGVFGISLLFIAGIVMTIVNKGFQFGHIGHWMKSTIGAIFSDKHITKHTGKDDRAISQFQSLCTALAATIGTGNIVGIATAIIAGGPGAIFWMWIMAIFGMMTNYSENVLGIFYRRKNDKGEWCGGAMYYLRDGLGAKKGCKKIGAVLAVLFSCFCVLASFGIGNMSQTNSIAGNMNSAFGERKHRYLYCNPFSTCDSGRIKESGCRNGETGTFYGSSLCDRCTGCLHFPYRYVW